MHRLHFSRTCWSASGHPSQGWRGSWMIWKRITNNCKRSTSRTKLICKIWRGNSERTARLLRDREHRSEMKIWQRAQEMQFLGNRRSWRWWVIERGSPGVCSIQYMTKLPVRARMRPLKFGTTRPEMLSRRWESTQAWSTTSASILTVRTWLPAPETWPSSYGN